MRNWNCLHCVREANSWASCRGNGEFMLSGMSVRTEWMHFLSASPQRLATSSAKMLFQTFHLLFTFSVGKCGPRREIRLQEQGKGMVVNTGWISHRRELMWGEEGPEGSSARPAVSNSGSARQAGQAGSFQWYPFPLMGLLWLFHLFYRNLKYDIWFHLYEILGKAQLI